MDFFDYRAQLEEGKLSGSIKNEMNRMQDWYNDENTKSNGGLLKSGLLPIVRPPFDRVLKGGALVMGINPGNGKTVEKQRADFIKSFPNGKAPTAYDWETKKWLTGGMLPSQIKTVGDRGKISDTYHGFDPTVDIKMNVVFVKNARIMFSDLGLKGLSSKIMWTNMIPFPSKRVGSFGKHEQALYTMSRPWVKSFLQLSKPSILFVPITVFDKLAEYHGMSHDDESETIMHKTKKGNYSHKFYQKGIMPDGTPVVGFAHWSSARVGGPRNPNWDEENIIYIKKDLERMLGVKAPRKK